MLRHFNFLNYNIEEQIMENIHNFSLSIQPQRIKYLEIFQYRLDLLAKYLTFNLNG